MFCIYIIVLSRVSFSNVQTHLDKIQVGFVFLEEFIVNSDRPGQIKRVRDRHFRFFLIASTKSYSQYTRVGVITLTYGKPCAYNFIIVY